MVLWSPKVLVEGEAEALGVVGSPVEKLYIERLKDVMTKVRKLCGGNEKEPVASP